MCFLRGPCRRVINGTSLELSPTVRRWQTREAEEPHLLEDVTRKRLSETLQVGEDLASSE
jgi:hypothetical protein